MAKEGGRGEGREGGGRGEVACSRKSKFIICPFKSVVFLGEKDMTHNTFAHNKLLSLLRPRLAPVNRVNSVHWRVAVGLKKLSLLARYANTLYRFVESN